MPSTEERINEREKVRAGSCDYTNPFVHIREIVVDEVKALAKIALVMTLLGTEKDRAEGRARRDALKMVMDRFPEIDWGSTQQAQAQAHRPSTVPSDELVAGIPPIGFKEDCPCPSCSDFRQSRSLRTLN